MSKRRLVAIALALHSVSWLLLISEVNAVPRTADGYYLTSTYKEPWWKPGMRGVETTRIVRFSKATYRAGRRFYGEVFDPNCPYSRATGWCSRAGNAGYQLRKSRFATNSVTWVKPVSVHSNYRPVSYRVPPGATYQPSRFVKVAETRRVVGASRPRVRRAYQ